MDVELDSEFDTKLYALGVTLEVWVELDGATRGVDIRTGELIGDATLRVDDGA